MTDKQALRGKDLPPRHYLAECQGCGVIMPSNKLIEAVNYPDGDADVHCPHCNADDCDIMDLGTGEEPAAIAWNYQQKRIEALLDELEAAEKRIDELDNQLDTEIRTWTQKCVNAEARIAELEARTLTVKLPLEYYNSDGSVNRDMTNTCEIVSAFVDGARVAGIALDTGE